MIVYELRDLIEELDKRGKVKKIDGADPHLEIGTITELICEGDDPATLLFDKIKGYPEGYRIVTNIVQDSVTGQKLSFGIPEDLSPLESVRWFKDKMAEYKPVPPVEVKTGPVMENVMTGNDIDIHKFPTPKWHEHDGGRYIGTGDAEINKDPDTGWLNVGTYRVMLQEDDNKVVSYYISEGKHGRIIRDKYWAKGEECPVVMVFGATPLLYEVACTTFPPGMPELDVMGYFRGKPVEVIKGPATGLPIPATAEIAIEGFASPPSVETRPEGPFGEWTGYFGSGTLMEPVLRIKGIYHRNNPILHGAAPLKPPIPYAFPIAFHSVSVLWSRLEQAGIPGIKGVYGYGPGDRGIIVIAIEQSYTGQVKEVATLAAAFLHGNLAAKYIIVVDSDIDPSNLKEVLWAWVSRCDPETQIDIRGEYLTSRLDPSLPPERRATQHWSSGRVFIDACRPFYRFKDFAKVNRASDELRKKVGDKWGSVIRA